MLLASYLLLAAEKRAWWRLLFRPAWLLEVPANEWAFGDRGGRGAEVGSGGDGVVVGRAFAGGGEAFARGSGSRRQRARCNSALFEETGGALDCRSSRSRIMAMQKSASVALAPDDQRAACLGDT